jgi:hypothetical protein
LVLGLCLEVVAALRRELLLLRLPLLSRSNGSSTVYAGPGVPRSRAGVW